jgi:hypothetical protein
VSTTLFVDGHVHIHPCFDIGGFFASAQRNLRKAALAKGCAEGEWQGALLLAESGAVRAFERLREGRDSLPAGIRIEPTRDEACLRVRVDGSMPLYLIAGRQVATTSGVEVLSLFTRDIVPDGLGFEDAMERSCATGGLTAIPWGFGKWSLARGNLVRAQLHARPPGSIALGDNGGRLSFGPPPVLFGEAATLGFAVLPGSDPFPFASQVSRVGTFGFRIDDWDDGEDAPATALLGKLRGRKASPDYFGRLTGPVEFLVSQVRMQYHNRFRPGRGSG